MYLGLKWSIPFRCFTPNIVFSSILIFFLFTFCLVFFFLISTFCLVYVVIYNFFFNFNLCYYRPSQVILLGDPCLSIMLKLVQKKNAKKNVLHRRLQLKDLSGYWMKPQKLISPHFDAHSYLLFRCKIYLPFFQDINYNTDFQTFRKKWGNDPRFEALDRKEQEHLLNERCHFAFW